MLVGRSVSTTPKPHSELRGCLGPCYGLGFRVEGLEFFPIMTILGYMEGLLSSVSTVTVAHGPPK